MTTAQVVVSVLSALCLGCVTNVAYLLMFVDPDAVPDSMAVFFLLNMALIVVYAVSIVSVLLSN